MIYGLPNYKGTIGYYVGGMTEKSLKESESCDVILATYSMAAEGMDIPVLDTLLLASPISAIEQPIGRIQRQKPEQRKHIPYVIDFVDEFSLFAGQGRRRIAFYKKQGYDVKDGRDIPLNRFKTGFSRRRRLGFLFSASFIINVCDGSHIHTNGYFRQDNHIINQ